MKKPILKCLKWSYWLLSENTTMTLYVFPYGFYYDNRISLDDRLGQIAKYKGEIPEGKVCLPTCYLFIHIWKLTYWIKKQTFWPLSTENSNSVLWSLMDSEVNFLNIGFSGYKILNNLGGSGIKIWFSKWFGHLVHQVLQWVDSKDSPQASDSLQCVRSIRCLWTDPNSSWLNRLNGPCPADGN